MAFITKEWKDRLTEFAGRRKLINVVTDEEMMVDVSRSEGNVSQPGDAFSAVNMNDLEQRISDEFNVVNSNLKWKLIASGNSISGQDFLKYNEIYVTMTYSNWVFIVTIPVILLSQTNKLFQLTGGAWTSANENWHNFSAAYVSLSNISQFFCYVDNVARKSLITVYGR